MLYKLQYLPTPLHARKDYQCVLSSWTLVYFMWMWVAFSEVGRWGSGRLNFCLTWMTFQILLFHCLIITRLFVYFHNLHGPIFLQRFKLSRIYRSFNHTEKSLLAKKYSDIYMLLYTVIDLLLFGVLRMVQVTFILSELCTSVESKTYTLTSISLGTRNILF